MPKLVKHLFILLLSIISLNIVSIRNCEATVPFFNTYDVEGQVVAGTPAEKIFWSPEGHWIVSVNAWHTNHHWAEVYIYVNNKWVYIGTNVDSSVENAQGVKFITYSDGWSSSWFTHKVTTRYELVDSSDLEALNSQVSATRNSADNAKDAADAAHADAQNAANRTWYNGNESAYWAYYGKVRAQQARDNAANAHTDAQAARNLLNGSTNGGKSLAATYDVASDASGDADYIREPQFPRSLDNLLAMCWVRVCTY